VYEGNLKKLHCGGTDQNLKTFNTEERSKQRRNNNEQQKRNAIAKARGNAGETLKTYLPTAV
jgi:hypothetical protein